MLKLHSKVMWFFIGLFTLWVATTPAELPPLVNNKPIASMNDMLKKAMPAVVNIYVQGQMPPGHYYPAQRSPAQKQPIPPVTPLMKGPKFQDVGSGVIVDSKEGLIVTNAHVVQDGQIIIVTLSDGRRFRGRLIGADNASDIAVIKINADNLTSLPIADSDKVQVGDFVAAIGNPFGLLNQSVTSGVVSALNRDDLGIEGYENFIQTDAPINPGNSGGALVNMQGELIGINTAILSPAGGSVGIGFAIPSNMAKSVLEQLIKYGKVERGLMGVMVQNLTPDLADALNDHGIKGALITQISPNSPAAKAGLEPKDIITMINGKSITNAAQLRNTIGLSRVGTPIILDILRNNKTLHITATIAPKQQAFATPTPASLLSGVRLRDFDEINFNAKEVKGVQVLDLDDNSPAALKGLIPGDVILTANNKAVGSVSELLKIANSNPKHLLLEVQRNGSVVFLVIDNN